jgi:hypothetical protein
MTLDEILDEWRKDSDIDRTELGEESLRTPQLHAKYYRLFSTERLKLRKMEADLKQLKLDKYEFYTQGPNEDTPTTWKLPPRGMVIKSDVQMYMESDRDIIDRLLKIDYQREKVEALESFVRTLTTRGYAIKNAIDFLRFTSGG